METNNKLRLLRQAMKESQGSLAESLGLSQSQVSRYEKGTSDLGQKMLERICCHWHITIHEFHARSVMELEELIAVRGAAVQ